MLRCLESRSRMQPLALSHVLGISRVLAGGSSQLLHQVQILVYDGIFSKDR
jgi:hypothetical protein